VIYADGQTDAWERAFGQNSLQRPLTLIVGQRKIVWQREGELDSGTLAAALRMHLAAGGSDTKRVMLQLRVRIGRRPPDFVFEYAPGRGLTLRKLIGRPVILVFWKHASRPSIEAVRDLANTARGTPRQPIVLAINDGEPAELAKYVAAENGLASTLVTDPQRHISLAYGVNIWPTTVFIDEAGLVSEIRYGRFGADQLQVARMESGRPRND
jgi:peroxiredoxin